MKHIEFEEIVSHFDGTLDVSESPSVTQHLRVCESCARSADKLREFFGFGRIAREEEVSQATTARLLNIFRPVKKPRTAPVGLRSILANLVFDDWQTAVAERGSFDGSRQLLYRADRFNIDIRLRFEEEHCQVSGQVFPDCAKASASLISLARVERVPFNEDSEFILPRVLCGEYDLQLEIDGELVEIPGISLRK